MPPTRLLKSWWGGREFLIPHSQFLIRSLRVGEVAALDTILVYTADGCPHCRALCEDFDRRGVVYREINLCREPQEMENLRDLSWERRLPVVADHERVSIGFRGASSTFAELGLE
jgi:glutaredoxin